MFALVLTELPAISCALDKQRSTLVSNQLMRAPSIILGQVFSQAGGIRIVLQPKDMTTCMMIHPTLLPASIGEGVLTREVQKNLVTKN